MPSHRFRLFGNLHFLQAIDKPGCLGRLLARHQDYFTRQGIDIDALTNDDDCARRLLDVFTSTAERMPGDLLSDLYMLDEVGDEDGHHRILDEAHARGIDLGGFPDDIPAGDFAILVFLDHPDLIRVCREKMVARQVKRYYEFRSRDDRRFTLAEVETAVEAIKADLASWFEERKRSRTCEFFVYQEDDEIHALITHGGLFRADGNITARLELSRLGWRPQKHDSIIYDIKTGLLKIHASYVPERRAYREALGRALAGDAGYFIDSAPYTLESLRTNGGVLSLVDGMEEARLTEVAIETGAAGCRLMELKGDDLTAAVAGQGALAVAPGEIVRACFALGYRSGGKARKLEVRLPNVADYDRDRDGDVTEAFVRANGFIAANQTCADDLVDAA